MKKSTLWLVVGIGAVVMLMIVGCCGASMMMGDKKAKTTIGAADSTQVDLEKLTKAFETYVGTGAKDINGFEKVINDKAKGIYKGKDLVNVTMEKSGEVIGYTNKDATPGYTKGKDTMVFSLQAEKDTSRVVARDRRDNYYRHRSSNSGLFTGLLVGSMLTRQRGFYGGRYYRAPAGARFRKSGYYSRGRSSFGSRSSSRGFRSSSRSGFGSRSSSRSGGFSSGKN